MMERMTRKSKSINSYVLKDPSAIGCMNAVDKLGNYEDLEDRLHGISIKQVVDGFIKTVENQTHEGYENGRILTNEDADRWNEYKSAEEQGLLLRLPCEDVFKSLGKMVYYISNGKIAECMSLALNVDRDGKLWLVVNCDESIFPCGYSSDPDYCTHIGNLPVHEWGKTVFPTEEEANQKVKEMEGK